MINSKFREKLRSGAPLLGVFVSIESPTTVELLAVAGVDYVMIDGEHNPITASVRNPKRNMSWISTTNQKQSLHSSSERDG